MFASGSLAAAAMKAVLEKLESKSKTVLVQRSKRKGSPFSVSFTVLNTASKIGSLLLQ